MLGRASSAIASRSGLSLVAGLIGTTDNIDPRPSVVGLLLYCENPIACKVDRGFLLLLLMVFACLSTELAINMAANTTPTNIPNVASTCQPLFNADASRDSALTTVDAKDDVVELAKPKYVTVVVLSAETLSDEESVKCRRL